MVYSHYQERIFSWHNDVYTKNESKVGCFSACLLFFLAICGKLPYCDVTRSQTKALCQNNGRDLLCNHFSNPCPHPISKLNHLISPTFLCSYVLCEHTLTQNVLEQTALIAFFCKLANQLFDLMNDLFSSRFGNLPRPLKEVNFLKWSVRVIFLNLLKHFLQVCTRSNTWNGAVSNGTRVPDQRSIKLSSLPSVWFICKPTLW